MVHEHECVGGCAWRHQRRMSVSLSITFRGLDIYVRIGWLAIKVTGPCLCLCYRHTQTCPYFYRVTGSLNPDPHICKASTIIHQDLSPDPQWLFLNVLPKLHMKDNTLKDDLSDTDGMETLHRTVYKVLRNLHRETFSAYNLLSKWLNTQSLELFD